MPPTGTEHFLAVVSKAPRDLATLGAAHEAWFLKLPTGDRAAQRVARMGGPLPALLGAARDCSGPACDEFGAARFAVDVIDR